MSLQPGAVVVPFCREGPSDLLRAINGEAS